MLPRTYLRGDDALDAAGLDVAHAILVPNTDAAVDDRHKVLDQHLLHLQSATTDSKSRCTPAEISMGADADMLGGAHTNQKARKP